MKPVKPKTAVLPFRKPAEDPPGQFTYQIGRERFRVHYAIEELPPAGVVREVPAPKTRRPDGDAA